MKLIINKVLIFTVEQSLEEYKEFLEYISPICKKYSLRFRLDKVGKETTYKVLAQKCTLEEGDMQDMLTLCINPFWTCDMDYRIWYNSLNGTGLDIELTLG